MTTFGSILETIKAPAPPAGARTIRGAVSAGDETTPTKEPAMPRGVYDRKPMDASTPPPSGSGAVDKPNCAIPFAGGGGASLGIEWALGRSPDIAINHDPEVGNSVCPPVAQAIVTANFADQVAEVAA